MAISHRVGLATESPFLGVSLSELLIHTGSDIPDAYTEDIHGETYIFYLSLNSQRIAQVLGIWQTIVPGLLTNNVDLTLETGARWILLAYTLPNLFPAVNIPYRIAKDLQKQVEPPVIPPKPSPSQSDDEA